MHSNMYVSQTIYNSNIFMTNALQSDDLIKNFTMHACLKNVIMVCSISVLFLYATQQNIRKNTLNDNAIL